MIRKTPESRLILGNRFFFGQRIVVPKDALDAFLVPSRRKVGLVLHLPLYGYRHGLLNPVAGRVILIFKGSPLMTRVPRVLSPQRGVVRGVAVCLALLPGCLQSIVMTSQI